MTNPDLLLLPNSANGAEVLFCASIRRTPPSGWIKIVARSDRGITWAKGNGTRIVGWAKPVLKKLSETAIPNKRVSCTPICSVRLKSGMGRFFETPKILPSISTTRIPPFRLRAIKRIRSEEMNEVLLLVKFTNSIPLNREIPASVAIHRNPDSSSHCNPLMPFDGSPFSVV